MRSVCNLRPSNGKQCAIDFGSDYVKEHGKMPSDEEIDRYLLWHMRANEYFFANQWRNVLRHCANRSARETINMLEKIESSDDSRFYVQSLKNEISRLRVDNGRLDARWYNLLLKYRYALNHPGLSDEEITQAMCQEKVA
jgi:hypothetical protein